MMELPQSKSPEDVKNISSPNDSQGSLEDIKPDPCEQENDSSVAIASADSLVDRDVKIEVSDCHDEATDQPAKDDIVEPAEPSHEDNVSPATEMPADSPSEARNAVRGLLTSVLKMDLGEILRKGRGRQKKTDGSSVDGGETSGNGSKKSDSASSWSRDQDSVSGSSPRGFLRHRKNPEEDRPDKVKSKQKKVPDESSVAVAKTGNSKLKSSSAQPLKFSNDVGEIELGKRVVKKCVRYKGGAAYKRFGGSRQVKPPTKNKPLVKSPAKDDGTNTECDWHTEAEETCETSATNSECNDDKDKVLSNAVVISKKEIEANVARVVDLVARRKVKKISRWAMTRKRRTKKRRDKKPKDAAVVTGEGEAGGEEAAAIVVKKRRRSKWHTMAPMRHSTRKRVPKTPPDAAVEDATVGPSANAKALATVMRGPKNGASPMGSVDSIASMCGAELLMKQKLAMTASTEITVSPDLSMLNGSVALSVKGRKRAKRKPDDLESVSSSKSTGSDTPSYKKRIAMGSNNEQWTNCKNPAINGVNLEGKVISTYTLHQPDIQSMLPLPLCTCRSVSGACKPEADVDNYCQAVDCIDNQSFGCCNTVVSRDVFRPAMRLPFQAFCEVHRQRLRLHQCCPGCGLFCTQGNFVQCRSDPRKSIHHAHKECLLVKDEEPLCPHCGLPSHLVEVRLELNTPRSTAFYLKQRPIDREPVARMTISRGLIPRKAADPVDAKSYRIADSGREISSVGLAVGSDRTELEELLVKLSRRKPAYVNYTERHILTAAKVGDVQIILHVLIMGFDPNTKFACINNQTAIHVSAASGQLLNVHVLAQAGGSLDMVDSALQTPLMMAVENKRNEIVRYLLKSGAKVEARGEDGMTELHLAAKSGNYDACRMILNTGKVNVNAQDDGGWTALVWAAEHRHIPIVRFLLERGADPNLTDNEQNVALHWAAFSGSAEIAEILLDHGCDLNSVNEHGDTPLHTTARRDFYECTVLFLSRNANLDARNKDNETPIMCCPVSDSQTYMSLSINEELKKLTKGQPSRPEIILYRDISRGKEANPIPCVNGVDDEGYPRDFLYILENCETTPINIDRVITSLQSCQCEDDCSSSSCTCGSISLKCWYDQEHRLVEEFDLLDPPMLFECNRTCLCWKSCNNRTVQHGIMCRLQLFRTRGKGWGVRALRDIPQGTFMCEYIGEVITDLEADQREDDSYLFDLDNRDGETYCLDARRYGNISRFVNHLCEPNLVPVKIFVDHQDLRFPRIAFFSSRNIKAFEELGFDYGEKFWVIKHKYFTCNCGSPKCKYSAETIQETLENYNRRMREEQEGQ